LFRNLVLFALRIIPTPISRTLKEVPFFQKIYRTVFLKSLGREGEIIAIRSGPMAGIKLVAGNPITHAQINGTYELDVANCIDRLVQPDWVCYDLGASTGYFSLLMAKKARRVYAFEPTPHCAEWIRVYADANRFDNIEIVPSVISDSEKMVTFAMTGTGYGSQVVDPETTDARWQRIELRSLTLDQFVVDHTEPDFLKIDIEGQEGRALEGAAALLERKRPVICCEIHDLENAAQVGKVLGALGYTITTLDGEPFEMPRSIYPGDFHVLCRPN
jgi:FkbM family methyltransferase